MLMEGIKELKDKYDPYDLLFTHLRRTSRAPLISIELDDKGSINTIQTVNLNLPYRSSIKYKILQLIIGSLINKKVKVNK